MRTVNMDTPPETFGRVLRRTDRDLRNAHMQRIPGYDYTAKGMAILHPDGVSATTLFYPAGKENAADRACHFGWTDCTDLWNGKAVAAPEVVAEPVAVAPPSEESLKAMSWPDLQALAKRRGIRQTGSRAMIEKGILASHEE